MKMNELCGTMHTIYNGKMCDAFGDLIIKTPIKVLFQDYTTIYKRVYVLYTGEDFVSSESLK